MFDSIFSKNLVWQIARRQLDPAVSLRAAERALSEELAGAVLAEAGEANFKFSRGPAGEPRWPTGLAGSVSHTLSAPTELTAICVVGRARGLGVDLENAERSVAAGLQRRICAGREVAASAAELLRLFSAKEATFKLFYPLTGKFFGFKDAELIWDPATSAFSGRLLKDLSEFPAGFEFKVLSTEQENLLLSFAELV